MSINPNTPYSMLFNFQGHLTNTQKMNLKIYQQEQVYKGNWIDIDFILPVEDEDGHAKLTKNRLKFFCTKQHGMSFLGISPGPKSLSEYTLFHKSSNFLDIDQKEIENVMFNVSFIQNAADMNWDIKSYMIINEMTKRS